MSCSVKPFTAPALLVVVESLSPFDCRRGKGLENTITEQDLDATSQQFVNSLRGDNYEIEQDLAVDGLSESLLSRLVSLLNLGNR